jgi:hypothetical protein
MTSLRHRHTYPAAACMRLLDHFMIDLDALRPLLFDAGAFETEAVDYVDRLAVGYAARTADRGFGRATVADLDRGASGDLDRVAVERLASALWGVFSHHRAVVDTEGRHYDLGSWRAAAELIADLVNRRHPEIRPPIRYMDCYMGVISAAERGPDVEALHRWIFSRLRDAGCEWLYSFAVIDAPEEQRKRLRELASEMSRAYDDRAGDGIYAPLPAVVVAYREVYGRLPDGWPFA